jgi:pimeloyl-ACP methyl ester carboxylesterase
MTFIFLHGSFHAAWNWHMVLPLLQQAGHIGIAMDLPAHGLDRTPRKKASLQANVDALLNVIHAQNEQVVLVAHSRNGIVISQTAELCPEKIYGLVYLAAYLVPNGKSMMDYAMQDRESLVMQNVLPRTGLRKMTQLIRLFRKPWWRAMLPRLVSHSQQVHYLDREAYRDALYHDCPAHITELANALLQEEPNWAGFTPLALTTSRYGRVPKVYIECLQDRAVTLRLQRAMQAEQPCNAVYAIDSGHSPFFSQPQKLTEILLDAGRNFAARS